MAAKPKKPAASGKSTATKTTPSSTIPISSHGSNYETDTLYQSFQSKVVPTGVHYLGKHPTAGDQSKAEKEQPDVHGFTFIEDYRHRPTQPYQGAAPLRPVQQSPILSHSQQNPAAQYNVQGVFSPQSGIQSPYIQTQSQYTQQHAPAEHSYYSSNPSPRSATGGAYYPSEPKENMAAATATMQRPYPPIYHTPQSNSPASVTSPQNHDHRPIYGQQQPQLTQSVYGFQNYQQLNPVQHSAYGSHHQQSPMNTQSMLQSYQTQSNQLQHQQMSAPQSSLVSSPRMKQESAQHYSHSSQSQTPTLQRQSTGPPMVPGQQTGAQTGAPAVTNAAPGPIPATTPLVVRQDNNGVQWILFEYSRDRVKMEYTIRCDVESVDVSSLSSEFKGENCVYPRACVPKDQYKGNRLTYETECNQVGWALASLNVCLQGKRGLIQRAVDSWRNSNQDTRLRSRRVRRQAKMNTRTKGTAGSQIPAPAGPSMTGHPSSGNMPAPSARPAGSLTSANSIPPQSQHHHHSHKDGLLAEQDPIGGSNYSSGPAIHRSNSVHQLTSPHDIRPAHAFPGYQPYPSIPTTMGPSMAPPIPNMHRYGGSGTSTAMSNRASADREQDDAELFGNVPDGKRRKFILVEDTQKNNRVRVKVTLDQIAMSEIPDSYRKSNSVFPRAYYPVQMQSSPEMSDSSRYVDQSAEDTLDGPPVVGRMSIPCQTSDGEVDIDIPQLSLEKRNRERKINELGYRMAWGQSRVFSGRPVFLARALDAYRQKQRSALASGEQETYHVPAHLETRPGKRRWHERIRSDASGDTSAAPMSV